MRRLTFEPWKSCCGCDAEPGQVVGKLLQREDKVEEGEEEERNKEE